MCLKFVSRSAMLQVLLLSHLMSSFYNIEASVSLNLPSSIELDDHRWIVLKEEVFTPLESPAPKDGEGDSNSAKSGTFIKKTIFQAANSPETRRESSGKDPSLFSCSNVTLKMGEYNIYDNGTLHVKAYRLSLNSSSYIQSGESVTICKPTKKEEEMSTIGKVVFAILTFIYSLITMFSALCSFSKNSTYLKLAFVSWICISSNIFLWIIVILIIPGSQSVFSWVSLSVNMNQSVYLTSVWMALLTSNRALKFLIRYRFIEISKRIVTVNVGPLAVMNICLAFVLAVANCAADKVAFLDNHALIECLFCNPIVYAVLFLIMVIEGFLASCEKNFTDVSRDYATYHLVLCKFSVFNFVCIAAGSIAVIYEVHLLLWFYTLFNFVWPLLFVKYIIPRLQTLLAIAAEEEVEEKFPVSHKKLAVDWEL